MSAVGQAVTLLGAVLILLSAIGVVRFPDALSRMQALTKASTVGVLFVALGAAFVLPTANDVTSAIAAAVLQLLTLPIAGYLIARATYRSGEVERRIDGVDELAEADQA